MHLLVLEDQRLLRDLLLLACAQLPPFAMITGTGDVTTALNLMDGATPADVVALSLRLAEFPPEELARQLRARQRPPRIVALSSGPEDLLRVRPGTEPFHGWVNTRTDPPACLREALRRAARHRRYISPSVRRYSPPTPVQDPPPALTLSSRECALLPLFAHGLTNQQIAERLQVSPHTAQAHRRNIMRKLGVHTTPQLIFYALRHGFARLPH